jgi:hypothetical protein
MRNVLAVLVATGCSTPPVVPPYQFSKEIAPDQKAVTLVLIVNKPRPSIDWEQTFALTGRFTGLQSGSVVRWEPTKEGAYPVTLTARVQDFDSFQVRFNVVDGKVSPEGWVTEYRSP